MKEVNYVIIQTIHTTARVGKDFAIKMQKLAEKLRERHYEGDPCFGTGVRKENGTIKVIFTDNEERHGFVLDFIKEAGIPVRVYDEDYKNNDWGDTYYSTWIEIN